MKKEKMKLWKKILLVIVIILLIFIAITLRKTIILYNIDKKVSELENNNDNIYIETSVNYNTHTSKLERYIKNDIDKLIVENTNKDGETTKIIQITYTNKRKIYTEKDGVKVMNVYEEVAPTRGSHIESTATSSYSVITNFGYSISMPQRILDSILTNIKTVEIDGKQCYEISSLYNSNFIHSENEVEMKAYVEKDTGLPVKLVEVINEDGKNIENITTYKYQFNIVTDNDMKEPDSQEYISQQ